MIDRSTDSRGEAIGDLPTPGQFDRPSDILVEPDGTLLVLNAGNGRVQQLTSDGTFLAQWDVPTPPQLGSCIALAANGRLFLADHPGGRSRIQELTSDGELLDTWTTGASADLLMLDKLGNRYVGQYATHVLIQYGPDGEPLRHWSSWPAWARTATCLVRDALGRFIVPGQEGPVRTYPQGLELYDPDGTLLWSSVNAPGAATLCAPVSIAVDPQGNWWVMDGSWSNIDVCIRPRIVGVAPDGHEITEWPVREPGALAWDSDGGLYLTQPGRDAVQRLSLTGDVQAEFGTPGDPDGR